MLILLIGCSGAVRTTCDTEVPVLPAAGTGENVLVLLLDDLGLDKAGAWGFAPAAPRTPRLDALVQTGVRFDRAYAAPSCSPTRASLLTGRHPSRHGIGWWMDSRNESYALPDAEVTFAEAVRPAGYTSGMVGKWHVSGFVDRQPQHDPQDQGFDAFRGILANPTNASIGDGTDRGYYHWERVDDGVLSWSGTYLTTAQVDDALALAHTLPEPWVLYVGFSAPHAPWDEPPAELAEVVGGSSSDRYAAVVQALDTELGRLLDGLGDLRGRTTILTLSDNGTPEEAVVDPWEPDRVKLSLYEGGVRVPLVVSGPQVTRPGVSDALVHVVDVFATILDIAGVEPPTAVDGRSLLPWVADPSDPGDRRCLMVERFESNGDVPRRVDRAVLDREQKGMRIEGEVAVYDVPDDPLAEALSSVEREDLLRELERYDRALR